MDCHINLPLIGETKLQKALADKIWQGHKLGDEYKMDGKPDKWKIAYYPIFANGKTGEEYEEPRALVEKPIEGGTDFREVPLRYLTRCGDIKFFKSLE